MSPPGFVKRGQLIGRPWIFLLPSGGKGIILKCLVLVIRLPGSNGRKDGSLCKTWCLQKFEGCNIPQLLKKMNYTESHQPYTFMGRYVGDHGSQQHPLICNWNQCSWSYYTSFSDYFIALHSHFPINFLPCECQILQATFSH